jgi:DNA-binding transcriptional LysR family regulator
LVQSGCVGRVESARLRLVNAARVCQRFSSGITGSGRMNLKQLQYVVAVADEGGFRQGAARLRVAQPALSRQVQNIERELGLQLFDRNSRRVSPTPAGEAFLRGIRLVLDGIADSVRRARLASEGRLGRCVIAASLPSLSNGALSRAVERIALEHPEIELTILEADVPDHWEMLRRGQVDLALGLRPPLGIEGICAEPLWSDSIRCALVPVNHRFARRATVRLAELRDDPYLALEPSLSMTLWTEMEAALRRAGVLDGRTRMVGSASGVRTLVAAGKGWSLVSEAYLEHPPTGTAALLVEDFSAPTERAALWRADDDRGVVALVRDVLRAVIANAPSPRVARLSRGRTTTTHAWFPAPSSSGTSNTSAPPSMPRASDAPPRSWASHRLCCRGSSRTWSRWWASSCWSGDGAVYVPRQPAKSSCATRAAPSRASRRHARPRIARFAPHRDRSSSRRSARRWARTWFHTC